LLAATCVAQSTSAAGPAIAATTVPVLKPAKGPNQFRGIFAFAGSPQATDPASPYLAGANIIYYWTQLEPVKGKIDFDRIDRDIAPWAAQHKVVCLRFSTAGWAKWYKQYSQQATPQWVYDEGVPSITEQDGARIPVYWNAIYLKELSDFVQALAHHLDGNSAIAYIQIGIGDGGETLADTYTPNKDRLSLWKPTGYTDELWWSTVQSIAGLYKSSFKITPLALMIDSTFLDKTPGLNFHTVSTYAAKQGFWLQDNGLTTKRIYDATWSAAVRVAEPREAAARNGATFHDDLQHAIDLNIRYFLAFRQDIYDPANVDDLKQAAALAAKP
jgi:hypothetical protein